MSETECPTCGRDDFASPGGMKRHHVHAHGESIAKTELECEHCGDSFTEYKNYADRARFCSESCKEDWESENTTGENNPVWNQVELVCGYCGEAYTLPPHRAEDSKFCSRECYFNQQGEYSDGEHPLHKRVPFECSHCGEVYQYPPWKAEKVEYCSHECFYEDNTWPTGEDNPCWKGGDVELVCKQCGEGYSVPPSRSDSEFCSAECYDEWKKGSYIGENNPAWNGGSRGFNYGTGWSYALKEQIRDRQNRQCAGCGIDEHELRRKLDVHHIIPARSMVNDVARNDESNLVALCHSCHKRYEGIPLRPQLAD